MLELKDLFFRQNTAQSLMNSISSNKLAHSYLFWGREGTAKLYTALSLAYTMKKLGGDPYADKGFADLSHPDINIVIPAKKEISDDQVKYRQLIDDLAKNPVVSPTLEGQPNIPISSVRSLIAWLRMPPTYPGGRYAIIHEAQMMKQEAANAFLKTLEEPSPESHIILLSTEPEALLPTIRSRLQSISFPPIDDESLKRICIEFLQIEETRIPDIVQTSGGSIRRSDEMKSDTVSELMEAEAGLWKAVISGRLGDQLAWAQTLPNDRVFADHLLQNAQNTWRNAMLISVGNRQPNNDMEQNISDKISDFTIFDKGLIIFEDLMYENSRNPLWNLFWSSIPLKLNTLFR